MRAFNLIVLWSALFFGIALAQELDKPRVQSEPKLPVVDYQACPFEGCTFREWSVTRRSIMFSNWKTHREQIGILHKGARVTGITGVLVTYKPDRILVKQPIADLALKPGDTILRYIYGGEGACNIWTKGAWHKGYDCSYFAERTAKCLEDCRAQVIENGRKEWWVQVKTHQGLTGWVLVQNNFSGMDILGSVF